jgi:hypothetical protein
MVRGPFLVSCLSVLCLIFATMGATDATDDVMRRLEQRLDEQAAEMAGLRGKVTSLEAKVAFLEGGNRKEQTVTTSVDSAGFTDMEAGRRLTHENPDHSCCRWTPGSTCGTVESTKYRQCTRLYEYLEAKTTSYDFENVEHGTCLGDTSSEWKWSYDGHVGHTALSKASGSTAVANIKTPLRVTLAENCAAAPTLTLQMNTNVDGTLTAGGQPVQTGLAAQLAFRYDWPNTATHTFALGGWRDLPDLTKDLTLTQTSTLVLAHYQISFGGWGFLACRLMVGGTEMIPARSIAGTVGAQSYATSSGQWIGAVNAGTTTIKVQCRNDQGLVLESDYMTKALTIAILG